MTKLNVADVAFEPGSVVDPVGRVFHFDGRVFRAVNAPWADFVENTLVLAEREQWFEAGLVPTWRSELSLENYPLVIEHRRVPFITLRGEWCGEALRSAALCILKVSAKLLRSGLSLKDSHPWNVLFDGARPTFIDWGSICPAGEMDWKFWYRQFRQYLLAPLYAFSIGEPQIARAMLREHKVGVGNEIMQRLGYAHLPEDPHRIAEGVGAALRPETFEALVHYVENLTIPRVDGEWVGYAQPQFSGFADLGRLREKDRIVHRVLSDDKGKTLIDIGTNNGLHSSIAASLGKRVIACDIEESCLNSIYLRTFDVGADILTLYHDFLWPIGTSGIFNTISAAEDRLACDTALVMAVTHHLAFKQNLSFEAMASGISKLAKRRAVVEFVPSEDVHVALWSPERLPWYNLDNFVAAMRRHFSTCTVMASDPHPRCIVVLEK